MKTWVKNLKRRLYNPLQLTILNFSQPSDVIILIPTAGAISNGDGNTTSTDDGTEVLI